MSHRSRLLIACLISVALAACGDEDKPANRQPLAQNVKATLLEDSSVAGQLLGSDPEGAPLRYRILRPPVHGKVVLSESSGAYTYTPDADYFGGDSLVYAASDGPQTSEGATVAIEVQNVNDAPLLEAIADLQNSAQTEHTPIPLVITDVDGDVLPAVGTSSDDAIASISADPATGELLIKSHDYGVVIIDVLIRDADYAAARSFTFTVTDVTRAFNIQGDETQAILFENTTDQAVTLTFDHNGFPLFQSDAEIVEFVRDLPETFSGEPFERKLWRFIRDNTYHAVQLSNDDWPFDPWVTVSSFGWGLCSQVANTYVRLARAAGYTARMWGIGPHVVPEVLVDEQWHMFDPDLAVYYLNGEQRPAGVEELAADTSLITAPIQPIFDFEINPYAYSDFIADIYGDTDDNVVASDRTMRAAPNYRPLVLPPRATFAYPLNVDSTVEGVHEGITSQIPHFLQGAITLESGWSGEMDMPWVVWAIDGTGTVVIDDVEYLIGSVELRDRIRNTDEPIVAVRVLSSASPVRLTFFVNSLRYELKARNTVAVTGRDIWAVGVHSVTVPEEVRAPWNRANPYFKLKGNPQ